jgi:N-methylhydantoinase B/oxoprolinase/acetone carboxylase alpha subunit
MTQAQRETGIERVATLENRNAELMALISRYEPSTVMEEVLVEIMAENETTIEKLQKATSAKYEFLFNFEGGGWNSEYAHTKEEAMELAKAKYSTADYKGTCVPDMKTFRVSTPADYNNLLSLFY